MPSKVANGTGVLPEPGIRVRVVNVVEIGVLMSPNEHPQGRDNISFEKLFTLDAPVIFAHHGYRWTIHSMVHGRSNEARFHVRGFLDDGGTTTPFDMVVQNKISRFHLAMDALKYVPRLRSQVSDTIDMFNRKLYEHHVYIREHLQDMPEIRNWHWTSDFTESNTPLRWRRVIRKGKRSRTHRECRPCRACHVRDMSRVRRMS